MAYYFRITGRTFGPFNESQLLEMKSRGRINRTTEISENRHDWQAAETFQFLFPPVHAPSQPSGSDPADWFYSMNGTDGFGPVTATAIEQMIQTGQLSGNSYVWQEGQNARFIKSEPRFSGSGVAPSQPSRGNTGGDVSIGGEITGSSESVDTGQMLHPVAASLGWVMFMKITFLLLGIVAQGLFLLWWSGFSISRAIAADEATILFAVLMTIVVWAALYALQFMTFLCFWKYHTDLYKTVATGRASDFIQANQSLFLFWKWLGITSIATLSVIVISVLITMVYFGKIIGQIQQVFQL